MDKIFEPSAVELADPRGDPNRAVEIQQKVEELLGANRQRQAGLRREILDQEAWALPGLINATYVWMSELEENPEFRETLADLMAGLAQKNPAAVDLLFRAGVLETPFPIPRSIARRALEKLEWEPDEKNAQQLNAKIEEFQRLDDIRTVLDLYALLLGTGSERGFSNAMALCEDWARRSLKQTGDLLVLLIQLFPDRAERTLTSVFLAAKHASPKAYRDENLANAILNPLRPIPVAWLQEGVLLQVSENVLPSFKNNRYTVIEYLWRYAVEDCKRKNPRLWQELVEPVGHQVQKMEIETVYRYWFRAVGEVNEMAYIVQQAQSRNNQWGTQAALQLFFQGRNKQAQQALRDLQVANPQRHSSAGRLYETISGERKEDGEIIQHQGPVTLTDSGH